MLRKMTTTRGQQSLVLTPTRGRGLWPEVKVELVSPRAPA
jgi:hypothetical protein